MAPKRKSQLRSRQSSDFSTDRGERKASGKASKTGAPEVKEAIQPWQWTDEQEMSLMKSITRWKPVGMHKHFRMLAIVDALRNGGSITSTEGTIRPQHVWEKLEELYNLEALDEREDGFGFPITKSVVDEVFCDFRLPEEDFKDSTFARRLIENKELGELEKRSPPVLSYQFWAGEDGRIPRPSTVEDSEDPRSSPASMKGPRGRRTSRSTRPSHLVESLKPKRGTRTSRVSVEASIEDGDEEADEGQEDTMNVDDDGKEESRSGAGGSKGGTRRSGRKR